jgi:hypothetical protein
MNAKINELLGEIEKCRGHLKRLDDLYRQATANLDEDKRTLEKAVLLSEIFVNYYTCLETMFFRVSQFFENSLSRENWHADLLGKMCLRIPEIREPVISEGTYFLLDELRKFRHFKRYYYSLDYDWDRLDYLAKTFEKLQDKFPPDIGRFTGFLNRLRRERTEQ